MVNFALGTNLYPFFMPEYTSINLSRIHELKDIRKQISQLNRVADMLCKPIYQDLRRLDDLFDIFKDLLGDKDKAIDSYNRKKFIISALWIFCPNALAGGKMRSGLRQRMAELMGIRSSTSISDNCSDLLMYYERYTDFRKDVNFIIKLFVELFVDSTIIV